MKKTLQHNQEGTIHPILSLVKRKDVVNVDRIVYILKKRKEGITYRQIQKDLLKDHDVDLSVQRIAEIGLHYKEAMQYV